MGRTTCRTFCGEFQDADPSLAYISSNISLLLSVSLLCRLTCHTDHKPSTRHHIRLVRSRSGSRGKFIGTQRCRQGESFTLTLGKLESSHRIFVSYGHPGKKCSRSSHESSNASNLESLASGTYTLNERRYARFVRLFCRCSSLEYSLRN